MSISTSSLRGDSLLILWGKIDAKHLNEQDLNDWWSNEHLPERIQLPGFLRARRYVYENSGGGGGGERTYLACYEASKLQALASSEYMDALNNPTPRTKMFMPCLAGMNRSACSVIYSKARHAGFDMIGNWMAVTVLSIQEMKVEKMFNESDVLSKALFNKHPSVVNVHLVRHDEKTTRLGSASKSYDGVKFNSEHDGSHGMKLISLIEFSLCGLEVSAITEEVVKVLSSWLESYEAKVTSQEAYQLICSMERNVTI